MSHSWKGAEAENQLLQVVVRADMRELVSQRHFKFIRGEKLEGRFRNKHTRLAHADQSERRSIVSRAKRKCPRTSTKRLRSREPASHDARSPSLGANHPMASPC